MASTNDVWGDFDAIRHHIKYNTVDKLKQILAGLNEECGTHFAKSGKKQEIIDRIVAILDRWRADSLVEKWIKAKSVVTQVRYSGIYTNTNSSPLVPSVVHNPAASIVKSPSFNSAGPNTSFVGRYDPYAPPRKPTATSTSNAPGTKAGVRFKESPFFRVQQAVSPVVECPESSSAVDRRQQAVTFNLTNEQITKLKSDSSKYQLRLFCTSSRFYSPTLSNFRPNTGPCPIEFPPTCDVRVNTIQLNANLKGLKKKPGTAPPPDLGKHIRLNTASNKVEMIYVDSQQPLQPKKYYLVVQLVEVVAVDSLVQELRKTGYKSSLDIRREMVSSMTVDDDIVAGPQKMSLKCPLSYMRVNVPCRSRKCTHSQCFDATSWFSVMEQTTTWLCPVCERTLDCNDLIIDGYFDEILQHSPESVEDVVVEADGEWHTSDNKYGSAAWKAAHPSATTSKLLSPQKSLPAKSPPSNGVHGDLKGKRKSSEILVLDSDSDDEDEGRVKRELSPSFASSSSINRSFGSIPGESHPQDDVIDLTLDSDSDEPPSLPSSKRTASDAGMLSPTEQIWKKGRLDGERTMAVIPQPVNRTPSSTSTSNGAEYPRPRVQMPVALTASRTLPLPRYSGPVLPYSTVHRASATGTVQLPPPTPNQYVNRWS